MSNLNENEDEVPTILHDKNRHEFQLTLSTFDNVNKEKVPTALLQYEIVSPNAYELYHTEVPPEFRGKGIAKVIARHAFDELLNKSEKKESNVGDEVSSDSKKPKLILSCSFLKNYFEKNKDSYEGCDVTQI